MQNLSFIIGIARFCLGTGFPDSSMVERLAVNEDVQGSSPCREALILSFVYYFLIAHNLIPSLV